MPGPFIWGTTGPAALQPGGIARTNGQILNFDGAKNYLANPLAETGDTTGWSLGTATLTSNLPTGTPTFGSGASGNLSLAATSTTPLSGTYSFSYTSSAATTAGNFLASNAFTVDSADLGKILNFSFSYKATSNPSNGNWSGTTSNSFAVAIYDVTLGAANWIIPVGVFNIIQSANTGVCTGSFQSSVTSGQQYRIVVYNANATAGAITLYFDQLFVGPSQFNATTSPIAASYYCSANQAGTTSAPFNFDTKEYDNANAVTTGASWVFTAPISGIYQVDLSAQFTASGTAGLNLWKNGSAYKQLGFGNTNYPIGSGSSTVQLNAGDTIQIRPSASLSLIGGTLTTNGVSTISIFLLQVAGIGPAGQVVAASAHISSGASTTASTPFNFDTVDNDTTASITTGVGSWKFTCPVSGFYNVSSFLFSTSAATVFFLYKNGSIFRCLIFNNSGTQPSPSSTIVQCNAGDTLDLRPANTVTPTIVTGATIAQCAWISIFLLQGPSAAQSSNATVGMMYKLSANNAPGANTPIKYDTKVYDTTNSYSVGTGLFTAPISGYYTASCFACPTGSATVMFQKNGADYVCFANTPSQQSAGSVDVYLNAGDTVSVTFTGANTMSGSGTPGTSQSWFCVKKVG